jgi:hypothetical protein
VVGGHVFDLALEEKASRKPSTRVFSSSGSFSTS